jgi:hypothetical protein
MGLNVAGSDGLVIDGFNLFGTMGVCRDGPRQWRDILWFIWVYIYDANGLSIVIGMAAPRLITVLLSRVIPPSITGFDGANLGEGKKERS